MHILNVSLQFADTIILDICAQLQL